MKNSIFKDQPNNLSHFYYSGESYDLTLTNVLKAKIEDIKKEGSSLSKRTGKNMNRAFQSFHYYLSELGLDTARDMIKKETGFSLILNYVSLYQNDGSYKNDI